MSKSEAARLVDAYLAEQENDELTERERLRQCGVVDVSHRTGKRRRGNSVLKRQPKTYSAASTYIIRCPKTGEQIATTKVLIKKRIPV